MNSYRYIKCLENDGVIKEEASFIEADSKSKAVKLIASCAKHGFVSPHCVSIKIPRTRKKDDDLVVWERQAHV